MFDGSQHFTCGPALELQAQHELVDKRGWLTREEFAETLSVGQVLPGPNIVNMALMIGDRFFGWRGALAAMAGLLLAPLAIVLVLAALYARDDVFRDRVVMA